VRKAITQDEVKSKKAKGKSTEVEADQFKLDLQDDASRIDEKAELADRAFQRFRQMQTEFGMDAGDFRSAKKELRRRLAELNEELNHYLAREYGVEVEGKSKKIKGKSEDKMAFEKWQESHQPFHWFVEFYSIIDRGGFDVIIGNPPYVEYKDVKDYRVIGFQTLECGDLYAYTAERSYNLLVKNGYIGLIVPISIFGTDGFETLQTLSLRELSSSWVSYFANRPSQLFDGAQKRLTILLGRHNKTEERRVATTTYLRWVRDEWASLFPTRIKYAHTENHFQVFRTSLEKLGTSLEISAFNKLVARKETLSQAIKTSKDCIYYTRKFGYFLAFLNFIPEITEIKTGTLKLPSELKTLELGSPESVIIVIAALSSSTFFWFWNVLSDCRNLNRRDLLAFPFNPETLSENFRRSLFELGEGYLSSLCSNSKIMTKSGLYIQTFDYSICKPIIDEIDRVLARHYGFTDEELDFIINYDIKYRMGRDCES
jgi:hypothetical protein